MPDRLITSSEWQRYEIVGEPSGEPSQPIRFAVVSVGLEGVGEIWIDDVTLESRGEDGTWTAIVMENSGFEATHATSIPDGWDLEGDANYELAVVTEQHHGGARALAIRSRPGTHPGQLFAEHASPGESIDKPIGAGIRAQIPLALWGGRDNRVRENPSPELQALRQQLDAIDVTADAAEYPTIAIAGVVITWNILQHFYPYFDVVDVDWEHVLDQALVDAVDDHSGEDFYRTLQALIAPLQDGHGRVVRSETLAKRAHLPLVVDWVEESVVVIASDDDRIKPGDVLTHIDGTDTPTLLSTEEARYSGSPQWRRVVAMQTFGHGAADTSARLRLRRGGAGDGDGDSIDLDVARVGQPMPWFPAPRDPAKPAIRPVADGFYYVDMNRASWAEIKAAIDTLAQADGVIFDLRRYPNGNHQILGHLTDEPVRSPIWNVAHTIYPDHERPVGYDTSGRWTLGPATPRLRGKIAFLISPGAISYAESVLGIVEHYKLGALVGQRTAGANGNVNPIALPGGFSVMFTGMKVTRHDGSQHHLVGIAPTVPVERTIAGIANGRDEVLEKALDALRAE